jgi:hypothetical protein
MRSREDRTRTIAPPCCSRPIGQTQTLGQKKAGLLTKQVEVGLTAIVDAITDGTLDDIDPKRYESIPERANVPRG